MERAKTAKEVVRRLAEWSVAQGGWNYPPHTPKLYEALGIPHSKNKVWAGLFGCFYSEVAGATVRVYASNQKRQLHRVFIICPECGEEKDAGHFNQHSCATRKD